MRASGTSTSGVLLDAAPGVSGIVGTGTSLGSQGTANQGTDILHSLHGSLAEPYANSTSRAWLMRNASLTIVLTGFLNSILTSRRDKRVVSFLILALVIR
jgi:hypothetical protein